MNKSILANATTAIGMLWLLNGINLLGQNYFPFEIQPVSTAHPQLLSQSASGPSFAPRVSADGQWIVFISQADNLVTNDLAQSLTGAYLNLYVYEMTNRAVQLVSLNHTGTAGGNNSSSSPSLSANGRWIAWASDASDLVTNDFNSASDVFVRDRLTGQTILASLNRQGTASGNGASSSPAISADGRYVAFLSAASDLVDGDTNKVLDVFVRDLESGVTSSVTRGALAPKPALKVGDPVISADGTKVAFWTTATNWVSWFPSDYSIFWPSRGSSSHYLSLVAVYDIASGAVVHASTGLGKMLASNTVATVTFFPYNPALSADGGIVAYKCNVVRSYPASNYTAILYYDATTGTNVIVTTNAVEYSPVSSDSSGPAMDDSGRWLVFLEKGTAPDTQVVSLFDRLTGEKTVVSHDLAGFNPAAGSFLSPAISADGNTIVYAGQSDQLLASGSAGSFQVYAYDRLTQSNRLISATGEGQPGAAADEAALSVSQDGRVIAFCSFDGPMVPGDRNHAQDVFVKSADVPEVRLVSAALAGHECLTANGPSILGRDAISVDSRYVVFASAADNLTPSDTNQATDVFVRDMVSGAISLVSVSTNNVTPANSWSGDPVISKDGRFVAFVSSADDLVPDYTNSSGPAVFVRDLASQTTLLVSANWTNRNANGNGLSSFPAISADGRWIAFLSEARDLCPTAASYSATGKVYLFDRLELTNGLANLDQDGRYYGALSAQPRLSDDGRFVLFHCWPSSSPYLLAYDRQDNAAQILTTNCYFAQGWERSWESSITGHWAVYSRYNPNAFTNIYRYDLVNKTNFQEPVTGDMPAISPVGRWLLYLKPLIKTSLITNWQLRLYDSEQGRESILSVGNEGWSWSPAGVDRAAPALSPDAAFAVFRGRDDALTPGGTNRLRRVFIRDIVASVTFNATEGLNNGMRGRWSCSDFWLSPDGRSLLLAMPAPDPSRGDRNGLTDIYCVRLKTGTNNPNGLPDNWCYRYFGRLDINATDDPDGDGLNNQMEFLAGTDPVSADSSLAIAGASVTTNGLATLSWPTMVNKNYRVQYRDDLSGANWADLAAAIIYDGPTARVIDPTPPTVSRFYRIMLNP